MDSFNILTWKKYIVQYRFVENLRVKDKRHIFYIMRNSTNISNDTYFPNYGLTAGEFALWQVLSENIRKKDNYKRNKEQSSKELEK